MIENIHTAALRNNELLQFFNDAANRCNRVDAETLKFKPVLVIFEGHIQRLKEVYNKEQGSDVTELLIQSDARRDADITGVRAVCEGYSYSRDAQTAEAATLLLNSINRQGAGIARMNYKAESQAIAALVKEWAEDDALTAALETLNLSDWVAALKQENANFSEIYQNRVDDQLASEGLSFSEIRAEATNAYKALTSNINAYSIIDSNEQYDSLIDALNLIIADYKALIDKRSDNNKDATDE